MTPIDKMRIFYKSLFSPPTSKEYNGGQRLST